MSDNFNALVVNQEGEKFTREIKKLTKAQAVKDLDKLKKDLFTLSFFISHLR